MKYAYFLFFIPLGGCANTTAIHQFFCLGLCLEQQIDVKSIPQAGIVLKINK